MTEDGHEAARASDDTMLDYIRRIMIAINQIDGIYYLAAKKMNLNENELALLYAIGDGKLHSQIEISEEWLIPKTTVNTIIRKYKEQGLLTLHSIKGHRREMHICLTEKGQEICSQILDPLYRSEIEAMRAAIATCSPDFIDEFKKFSDLLELALRRNIISPSVQEENKNANQTI